MTNEIKLLETEICDLKGKLADYNASLQGWKASYEGEAERHKATQVEFQRLKTIANGYIDLLNDGPAKLLDILESLFDRDRSQLSYEDLETYYDIAKSIGRKYRLTEVQNELDFRLHTKRVVFNGLWNNYDKPLFI